MSTVSIRCFTAVAALWLLPVPSSMATPAPTRVGFATENCDTNGDQLRDLGDGVYLLGYLFLGTDPPVPLADCGLNLPVVENGDSNGDGILELPDAVHIFAWLFSGGEAPAGACSRLEMGTGGIACRPYVAPPGSRAYGRSLTEWLGIYWRWYYETGADPDQSLVGRVKLFPIPVAEQISGSGTPADPAVLRGQIDVTLSPGTPFVMPQFAWIAERYDPALGIPDDPSFPDEALFAGVSPNLSINGCPVVSDVNETRFYVPATPFVPPVVYPEPSSYGSIAALSYQGCGVVALPLPPGDHVMTLYEPYIIDDVLGFSFGIIYENTWNIHVTAE